MGKDLSTVNGTIAKVLTKHQIELWGLIENGNVQVLHKRVMELLEDPSIKNKEDVVKAKDVLTKCLRKPNLYYSTLITYVTGMKVSL